VGKIVKILVKRKGVGYPFKRSIPCHTFGIGMTIDIREHRKIKQAGAGLVS